MEKKKAALKETFDYLDTLRPGEEFTAVGLSIAISRRISEYHTPDTYLRYMRYYRQAQDKPRIICISRSKSLYRVEGAA